MKVPLFLSALAAALLWGAAMLDGVSAAGPADASPARTPAPAAHTVTSALEVRDVSGIDAAAPPLFRPATAPVAASGPAPGEAFSLIGLAGTSDARIALLRDRADSQVFSVRNGESVRDWTVSETNDRCVALRKGRHRQDVCLQ